MILLNGTEIIVKPYQEEDAEEIVNLIIRNMTGAEALSIIQRSDRNTEGRESGKSWLIQQ